MKSLLKMKLKHSLILVLPVILLITSTTVVSALTDTEPIFSSDPAKTNGLIIQENFEDFVYKGPGGAANKWYKYGPTTHPVDDVQWINTGNNNHQLVREIKDGNRTVKPREGNTAIKWFVDMNDIGSSSYDSEKQTEWRRRSEVRPDGKGIKTAEYGEEYWYGFSTYLATDYADETVGEIIFQIHSTEDYGSRDPNGPREIGLNPPFALSTSRGRYALDIRGDDREIVVFQPGEVRNYRRYNKYDLGPIQKGEWVDWVVHIKWSYNLSKDPNNPAAGFVRIWKNGKIATPEEYLWGANDYNNLQPAYIKFGIYKSLWGDERYRQRSREEGVTTRTVYHDALRVSKRLPGEAAKSMNGYTRVAPRDGVTPPPTPPPTKTPDPTPTPELTPTPTPVLTPTPILGDIAPLNNPDGKVNIFDYNLLLSVFGQKGSNGFHPADINKDGEVSIFDYSILLQQFQ